jgi:hypothetical protein
MIGKTVWHLTLTLSANDPATLTAIHEFMRYEARAPKTQGRCLIAQHSSAIS